MILSLILTILLFLFFCFAPIILFERQDADFKKKFRLCRLYVYLFIIPFFSSFLLFFKFGFNIDTVFVLTVFFNSAYFPAACFLLFVPLFFDFYLYIDKNKRIKNSQKHSLSNPLEKQ